MPTHWAGPLSTGETVLMIINRFDKTIDVSLYWKEIPALRNSTATLFHFTEISTRYPWRSGSSVGFWYSALPPHGSLVMIVTEDNPSEGSTQFSMEPEWAELDWHEIHHE
jgi:hypothetical protein